MRRPDSRSGDARALAINHAFGRHFHPGGQHGSGVCERIPLRDADAGGYRRRNCGANTHADAYGIADDSWHAFPLQWHADGDTDSNADAYVHAHADAHTNPDTDAAGREPDADTHRCPKRGL